MTIRLQPFHTVLSIMLAGSDTINDFFIRLGDNHARATNRRRAH